MIAEPEENVRMRTKSTSSGGRDIPSGRSRAPAEPGLGRNVRDCTPPITLLTSLSGDDEHRVDGAGRRADSSRDGADLSNSEATTVTQMDYRAKRVDM